MNWIKTTVLENNMLDYKRIVFCELKWAIIIIIYYCCSQGVYTRAVISVPEYWAMRSLQDFQYTLSLSITYANSFVLSQQSFIIGFSLATTIDLQWNWGGNKLPHGPNTLRTHQVEVWLVLSLLGSSILLDPSCLFGVVPANAYDFWRQTEQFIIIINNNISSSSFFVFFTRVGGGEKNNYKIGSINIG